MKNTPEKTEIRIPSATDYSCKDGDGKGICNGRLVIEFKERTGADGLPIPAGTLTCEPIPSDCELGCDGYPTRDWVCHQVGNKVAFFEERGIFTPRVSQYFPHTQPMTSGFIQVRDY